MEIVLSAISLRNFKGVRNLNVDFVGARTDIYGANETGKTTIFDGFLWCLFGKDSQNKSDFAIKPLDQKGEASQGLDHSVDVALVVNGKTLIITRTLTEKWTKKRGTAKKEFTGHTTDYFFDGVPVKESDFNERVRAIINENVFRLLTDPRRFNEQLSWTERRKILMEICGDISDQDVIASDKKLTGLTALLAGYGVEDLKKIIAARKKAINDELEKIPVRIDEAERSFHEVTLEVGAIHGKIGSLEAKKQALEEKLADLRNGGILPQKRNELAEVDAKILAVKVEHDNEKRNRILPLEREIDAIREGVRLDVSKGQDLVSAIGNKKKVIALREAELDALRAEWINIDAQKCIDPTTCPACGQPMPEFIIEETRERFLNGKALKLDSIDRKGKTIKATLEEDKAALAELEAELGSLPAPGPNPRYEDLTQEILRIKNEEVNHDDLDKKRKAIQEEIDNTYGSEKEGIELLQGQIETLKADIFMVSSEIQKANTNEITKKRIEDLEDQQKALGKEYEEVSGQLFLVESFTRTKVSFLEKRINDKFALARFKLFEEQINGALTDICETTLKGVPYSSINNAGRIQVGMDIIKTLQSFFGITAPIWIDNRESIVDLPEMGCQVISLVVSGDDKNLRIEGGK